MASNGPPSYQNKNGAAASAAVGEDHPLLGSSESAVELERRKRNRLCLVLSVFCVFLMLVGALAVWSNYLRAEERAAERAAIQAAAALARLNKNLHAQSKLIKSGCETTLLIMRHCEKEGPFVSDKEGNDHCSYLGFERAKYISSLFGKSSHRRWPAPSHLFAFNPDRGSHWTFREWETLHPLSLDSGVGIDITTRYDFHDEYFDLLQSGSLCGMVSVISWKHEFIPELAVSVGCGPSNGCPASYPQDSFDQVWQLKYVFHPEETNPKSEKDLYDNDAANSHNDTSTRRRHLKHKSKSKHGWNVYATITNLNFDPLAFSKLAGDYPDGGTSSGGRWQDEI